MRKKIIAGNWKMNKLAAEAKAFVAQIKGAIDTEQVDVVLCVPFTNLETVLAQTKGTQIAVGAQNMHFEESGAYTGEIAAPMLKEIGVQYVIIGHSERRQYFCETDETVNKKVLCAIKHGLTPILCVGESLTQREQGITVDLVRQQTKIALKDVSKEQAAGVVIAYEPIWAIGTGKVATNEQAEEVCAAIRTCLCDIYDHETAQKVRIQYGGSVTAASAAELFAMENIDGGLVGGASLKTDFEKIVNYTA